MKLLMSQTLLLISEVERRKVSREERKENSGQGTGEKRTYDRDKEKKVREQRTGEEDRKTGEQLERRRQREKKARDLQLW
jgi:hypothetical protein